MRKLFWALVIFFYCTVNVGRNLYVDHSWKKDMVDKCVTATTVIFVQYPNGEYGGSGVLISKEGRVLTAAHLFTHGKEYPDTIMLTRSNNSYNIRILAVNARLDLALVEPIASAQDFPFAKVQKSNELYVGQDVLIVGHPYSLLWNVTSGIITRLAFNLWYFCVIAETDALVNPGNSGGPVFNTKGEVIGIVSAMRITPQGIPMGIGLFIPVKQIHLFLTNYDRSKPKSQQIKRHSLKELVK